MTEMDEALLTVEAKIAKLKQILPEHGHTGKFFLPDQTFYIQPLTNNGLRAMAMPLCAWIGFKPVGIEFCFAAIDSEYSFDVTDSGPKITINRRFARNPYATASLLASCLIKYYVEYRKHLLLGDINEQKELIALGVVYSGLGLVGLNYSHSFWQEQYPQLYYQIHRAHGHSKSSQHYARFNQKFASDHGLSFGSYIKYLCPWVWPYFPAGMTKSVRGVEYVEIEKAKAKNAYLGLIGCLLFVSFGAVGSGYILSQRPKFLPANLSNQKEEIEILRKSYELCSGSITKKENAYNKSDFFIQRNIEADQNRCASLRNSYNYRVDQYNKQLKSL